MKNWTAEEVRRHADFVIDKDYQEASQMLTAFAERIEADEGVVACGYLITWRDPSYRGNQTLSFDRCHAEDGTFVPVFTRPPAQAAQVEAPPHCKGHMQFEYDCLDCSDVLERKRKAPTAEPSPGESA